MIGATHRDLVIPNLSLRRINIEDFSQYWENEGNFEKFFDGLQMENVFFALQSSATDWQQFIQTHDTDSRLQESFQYTSKKGTKYSNIKCDIIGHAINHSTHHRGQISCAFTQLCPNIEPVCLDLPYTLREESLHSHDSLLSHHT